MFGRRNRRATFFTPRVTDITPQPLAPTSGAGVTFEDEYEDEPVVIAPPKSKKNRLPGVRLLRQLQKARQAELQGKMRDLKI